MLSPVWAYTPSLAKGTMVDSKSGHDFSYLLGTLWFFSIKWWSLFPHPVNLG